MPKKQWTDEERKAFGEKMKAARLAKEKKVDVSESAPETLPQEDTVSELLRRIKELEERQFFSQPAPAPVQPVRAITKFSVVVSDYPDPRERLADEPKLQEHAFKHNFQLKWEVGKVSYQHDGVNYTEPKFVLELWRWMRDPDTQELTTKQYRVHRATFFEDPEAALDAARQHGVEIDDTLQKPFLDEMRYLRMRDWLFEIFYPQPVAAAKQIREEVVGNRLVRVFETSSSEKQSIPFDKLKM